MEQFRPVNHTHNRGLAIELGFLFHMLDTTAQATARDGCGRSAQPTNFLRAFRRIPRTIALGLAPPPKRANTLITKDHDDKEAFTLMAAAAAAVASAGVRSTSNLGRGVSETHDFRPKKPSLHDMDAATQAAIKAARVAVAALAKSRLQGSTESRGVMASETHTTSGGETLTLTRKAEAFLRFLLTEFDQELSSLGGRGADGKSVKLRRPAFSTLAASSSEADGSRRATVMFAGIHGGLADSFVSVLESQNSFVNAAFARDNSTHASYSVVTELTYPAAFVLRNLGVRLASVEAPLQYLPADGGEVSESSASSNDPIDQVLRPLPPGWIRLSSFGRPSHKNEEHKSLQCIAYDELASAMSFAEILRGSLCKLQRTKAFSATAAAESVRTGGGGASNYQHILQRRYPKTLPPVLAISCATSNKSDGSSMPLWRGTNILGGSWLPRRLQIKLHPNVLSSTSSLDSQSHVVVAEYIEEALPAPSAVANASATESEHQLLQATSPRGCWAMVDRSRSKAEPSDPVVWLEGAPLLPSLLSNLSSKGGGLPTSCPPYGVARASASSTSGDSANPNVNAGSSARHGRGRRGRHCGGGGSQSIPSTGHELEARCEAAVTSAARSRAAAALGIAQMKEYELLGVVSHVRDHPLSANADGHLVCHISVSSARATNEQNGVKDIIRALELGDEMIGESDNSGRMASAASSLATTIERTSCCGNGKDWVLFNDFIVEYCSTEEVLSFHNQPWREPCSVLYREVDQEQKEERKQFSASKSHTIEATRFAGEPSAYIFESNRNTDPAAQEDAKTVDQYGCIQDRVPRGGGEKEEVAEWKGEDEWSSLSSRNTAVAERRAIPSSVFSVESLSMNGGIQHHWTSRGQHKNNWSFKRLEYRQTFELGHLIAIDTEFVTVAEEDMVLNSDGRRSVRTEARQVKIRGLTVLFHSFDIYKISIPLLPSCPLKCQGACTGICG